MQHGDVTWCTYPICDCTEPDRACTAPSEQRPATSGYMRVSSGMKIKGAPLPDLKDPLLAVIDRQLEIERKAAAWDSLRAMLLRHPGPYRVTMVPNGTSWSVTAA